MIVQYGSYIAWAIVIKWKHNLILAPTAYMHIQ